MRTWLPVGWVVLLSLVVMLPTLGPGFVLSYDLVFTPRQDLLPAALGLGGSLPRAVPQDAVVALLEAVMPGEWLEKAVLLAIPLVTGLGMLRLLRAATPGAQVVAATLAIWNPYVAERLVIGHWGLLLAYAIAPWAIASAVDMRRGVPGAGLRLILQLAVAGLTPSGSLLAVCIALPIALGPGGRATPWHRAGVACAAIATWLPWLVPAVLHPAAASSDSAGLSVFALRAKVGGHALTALGLGGIWNAEVVPLSRTWPTGPILAIAVLLAAAYGARPLVSALGRAACLWWAIVAAAGLVTALASAWLPGPWQALLAALPGGGLLRDAHKLLAPLALLLAAAAGLGVARVAARVADRATRGAIMVAAALIPIALLPDLAWGVAGRLAPVAYPPAWAQVRDVLAGDPRPGDVVVLPWSTFRAFEWNAGRTVLDPAPRWLPRSSVVDDQLVVATPEGLVALAGEDPRARAVTAALDARLPLVEVLPPLGVGWVLIEEGQRPTVDRRLLEGLESVDVGAGLLLYAVPGQPAQLPEPLGAALVIATDLALACLVVGVAAATAAGAIRRRRVRPKTGEPLVR